MDSEKGEIRVSGNATQRITSQDEAQALKKCLEESKGDHDKCKSKVDSFFSSSSSVSRPRKRLPPLRLRSGTRVAANVQIIL
ncbi:hypothetical protein GH714_038783 [Hevea brasiliensis]|uniref:Uncharacterized protein n=1 Tax=Hevea brasiliensis TaxID=3981 RepID=A0A6A6MSN8_HEVBR|nr:hypothetical protein GH714_038783 [Hevea brasiliensis]